MKTLKNKRTKTIKKKTPALKNTVAQVITKTMLDNVAIGVSLISPNMEIIWLNKFLKERFPDIDTRKKPLCYQSFYTPPKEKICDYCPTIKAFKTGRVHSSETDVCANGKIYNVTATPVKDKKNINYVIETIEDITEHKKINKAILKAKIEWETTFDNASELIILVDKEFKIIRCNKSFAGFAQRPFN